MEYTFTVRQETGLLLLGGLALCLLLVFVAGWLVGVNSQVTQLAADTSAATTSQAPTRTSQATTGRSSSSTADREVRGRPTTDEPASARDTSATQGSAAPPSDDSAPPSSPQSRFAIQVGGFAERANAQAVAEQVRRDGRPVDIETERRQGRVLHQVWVGRYDTKAAAQRRLDAVRNYTGNAFVVRRGGA